MNLDEHIGVRCIYPELVSATDTPMENFCTDRLNGRRAAIPNMIGPSWVTCWLPLAQASSTPASRPRSLTNRPHPDTPRDQTALITVRSRIHRWTGHTETSD